MTTLLGRRRYLPDLRSSNPVARNAAERMAMNAPVQGTASDMIKIAMVRLPEKLREGRLAGRPLRARVLLQVHDELVLEVPEKDAEVVAVVRKIASQAVMFSAAVAMASESSGTRPR